MRNDRLIMNRNEPVNISPSDGPVFDTLTFPFVQSVVYFACSRTLCHLLMLCNTECEMTG
jgi:hypothetical protein